MDSTQDHDDNDGNVVMSCSTPPPPSSPPPAVTAAIAAVSLSPVPKPDAERQPEPGSSGTRSDSPAAAAVAPPPERKVWTESETLSLLSFRESFATSFTQAKRNRRVWHDVSERMQQAGHRRTPVQCAVRWKNVQALTRDEIRTARRRAQGGGGGGGGGEGKGPQAALVQGQGKRQAQGVPPSLGPLARAVIAVRRADRAARDGVAAARTAAAAARTAAVAGEQISDAAPLSATAAPAPVPAPAAAGSAPAAMPPPDKPRAGAGFGGNRAGAKRRALRELDAGGGDDIRAQLRALSRTLAAHGAALLRVEQRLDEMVRRGGEGGGFAKLGSPGAAGCNEHAEMLVDGVGGGDGDDGENVRGEMV